MFELYWSDVRTDELRTNEMAGRRATLASNLPLALLQAFTALCHSTIASESSNPLLIHRTQFKLKIGALCRFYYPKPARCKMYFHFPTLATSNTSDPRTFCVPPPAVVSLPTQQTTDREFSMAKPERQRVENAARWRWNLLTHVIELHVPPRQKDKRYCIHTYIPTKYYGSREEKRRAILNFGRNRTYEREEIIELHTLWYIQSLIVDCCTGNFA